MLDRLVRYSLVYQLGKSIDTFCQILLKILVKALLFLVFCSPNNLGILICRAGSLLANYGAIRFSLNVISQGVALQDLGFLVLKAVDQKRPDRKPVFQAF